MAFTDIMGVNVKETRFDRCCIKYKAGIQDECSEKNNSEFQNSDFSSKEGFLQTEEVDLHKSKKTGTKPKRYTREYLLIYHILEILLTRELRA